MSRSSSMGDLVPRDITEVLALQSKVSKGTKKRGSSLGRAFSWFKGNKQKKSVNNRHQSRTMECVIRQGNANHDSSKAGQKQDEQRKLTVHYTASQHYQENVFIEGSRPKYLEDLHTEAQEGLKILQQEELSNGVDCKDDQTVSTVSPQKDQDYQEGDGQLDFDSTADPSITSVANRSAASSRPVLTRQGSTFKPLNTVKRLDNTKKRTRRTTIMGIPQQVQRELCMGRGALLKQFPNNEDDSSPATVIIPTIDGGAPVANHEGARVHLQDIEALQASRDEQLLRHHIQAVYRDDLLLNRQLGPRTTLQRPKSLAVPEMTTSSSSLQEPQGPVMSISPQATYLSTIIPNAVLPAAIDVIEIDRTRNRRSMRTVSKSSLASASPSSSRSGGGTHDVPPSSSSKWSPSQSSETIVSNSSTVSLRGKAPLLHVMDSMKKVSDLNQEEQMSLKSSSSWLSSSTQATSPKQEQEDVSDAGESVRNSQLFTRSLSVMKAKLPPAPPRRTYSLHQEKLKQRSRELGGTQDSKLHLEANGGQMNGDVHAKEKPTLINNELKSSHSPVTPFLDDTHSSLTSSPRSPDQDYTDSQTGSGNSSPQNKFERTMSPSSGYSSQSGTPTHSSKDMCPPSPGKHKVKPPKPERMGPRTSPVVSVSSSITSLSSATMDPAPLSTQTQTTQSQPPKVSLLATTKKVKVTPAPSGPAIRDLFNIPPPPKVKAPCPPPPETWAHNKRTVELLCGPSPCPNRICVLQKQQQKDLSFMRNQDHANVTSLERQERVEVNSGAKNEAMSGQKQATLDESLDIRHKESPQSHEKDEESRPESETASEDREQEQNGEQKLEQESRVTLEKVPLDKADPGVLSSTQHLTSEMHQLETCVLQESDHQTLKTEVINTKDQTIVKNCPEKENPDHIPNKNLGAEPSRVTGNSPPPSPPPAHHPPPPPSKKSPPSSVSGPSLKEELQSDTENESSILESSWPPPPPPLEELSDLVFEGQDEMDFPPPPPPLPQVPPLDLSQECRMESTAQEDQAPQVSGKSEEQPAIEATESDPEVSEDKSLDQSQVKAQSSENVLQVYHNLACSKGFELLEMSSQSQEVPFQPPTEETSAPPQQDSPNPHTVPSIDVSNQGTSEAPPLTTDMASPLQESFRRQPSLPNKDPRIKEHLPRHKSAPIPKEDANIPLVTPSLLQMVRLRSVNVEDQVNVLSQDGKPDTEDTGQDQGVPSQVIPQKPIRKSCLKSAQSSAKSSPAMVLAPSMCLQEAIRMKTAAMSSTGVPTRLSLRLPTSSTNSNDTPASPKSPESCDLHKSPASTASFIFSKSTKKVVIETPSSPEAQAALKQNLAAELMQLSEQAKSTVTPGTSEARKHGKVPPPVAKKPTHATHPSDKLGTVMAPPTEGSSSKQKNGIGNGQIETVQPAGQRAQSAGTRLPASATETLSTLEVS